MQHAAQLVVGRERIVAEEPPRREQVGGAAQGDAEPDLLLEALAFAADGLGEAAHGRVRTRDDGHLAEALPLQDEDVHGEPVVDEKVDHAADERTASTARGTGEVLLEHELELVDGRPDGRLEQRLFRAVVIEHARLRIAGMVGDLLQRGRREADRRELLEGSLAQLVARAHAQRGLGFGGHGTTVLDRSVSFCTIGQIHGRLTARVHLAVALPSCASTSSAGP